MPEPRLPFFKRLSLAFRVLTNPGFAAQCAPLALALPEATKAPAPEPPEEDEAEKQRKRESDARATLEAAENSRREGALQLLSLLQREGRLVDFLQQGIDGFSDAEIGAAARLVHQGCTKALSSHLKIKPVFSEAEGASITVEPGFNAAEVKLTGNVQGQGPYRGVLRHRGWRAEDLMLPQRVGAADSSILAPGELELR